MIVGIKIKKKIFIALLIIIIFHNQFEVLASTISSDEVQTAVDSLGKEAVTGNVLIWFLCAVGFLKLSNKMESILSALGLNVGSSQGKSLLGAAIIAMKGISTLTGGESFGAGSGSSTSSNRGSLFQGGLSSIIGRKISDSATASVTGQSNGSVAESLFNSSLANGGDLAKDVISNVAQGDIGKMGSVTGDKAASSIDSTNSGSINSASDISNTDTSTLDTGGFSDAVTATNEGLSISDMPFSENNITQPDGSVISGTSAINDIPYSSDTPFSQDLLDSPDIPNSSGLDGSYEMGGGISTNGSEIMIGDAPFTSENSNVSNSLDSSTTSGESLGSISQSTSASAQASTQISTASQNTSGDTSLSKSNSITSIDSSLGTNYGSTMPLITSMDSTGGLDNQSSPGIENANMPISNAPPQFSDVEIGGGRITGTEKTPANPSGVKFSMYSTDKYTEPTGSYSTVDAIDVSKWYKQYAVDTVNKEPYKENVELSIIVYQNKCKEIIPSKPSIIKMQQKMWQRRGATTTQAAALYG